MSSIKNDKSSTQTNYNIPVGRTLLGTYFGFVIILFLGAMFNFFPFNFIFNDWEGNIMLFGLLMISILIVICTILVIEEIRALKKD